MLPCQYGSQVLIRDSFPLDRLDLIGAGLLFLGPVPSLVSILQAELVREFFILSVSINWSLRWLILSSVLHSTGRGNYNNTFYPVLRKILLSDRLVID